MGQVRTLRDIQGHLGPGTSSIVQVRTSWDIPGCEGTLGTWELWALSKMGEVRTSQDIPGCEGTLGTWDFGHCPRWDRLGHRGISQV